MFYSVPNTGLLPPWLGLFLSILFFLLLYQMGFFLVYLSDIALLVYKNAIDFWILTLYPTILPNSLIRSSSVLVESVRFPIYRDISSMNNDRFTTPFSIWMSFISSSYLMLWLGVMLNNSGESRNPCLVPDLKGNT